MDVAMELNLAHGRRVHDSLEIGSTSKYDAEHPAVFDFDRGDPPNLL